MKTVLGILKAELYSIDVPYAFMRWDSDEVPSQYWVGEYTESITDDEDGGEEVPLVLTGTTRGSWMELEQTKEKIKHHFPAVYGLRKSTDEGAVVIYYENSFPVDTGEADLKRLQVNLKIKQWKGTN